MFYGSNDYCFGTSPLVLILIDFYDFDTVAVKYEARLEDGTVVGRSDGLEFTVQDG